MNISISSGSIKFGEDLNHTVRKKGKSKIDFPSDYIIFDLETTGLDPRFDSIIEIGAAKVVNNDICEELSILVNPFEEEGDIFIPTFITELTGITSKDIMDKGVATNEAIEKFIDFVKDDIVIGYNVNFDINFIYDNYNRILDKHFNNDYIDVMRLARKALPNLKRHRLKDVKRHLGFDEHQEHRAASDVLDTKRIFDAIKKEVSLNQDIELFKKTFSKQSLKAKDILTKETDFDQSNPFYGSHVCFTGKMDSIVRREAMQLICDLGGIPEDRVTMQTNYLVLGDTSYSVNVKDGVTGKMKKAQQLIGKGQELEILSESVFIDMLEN
ncbi:hypothetical protein FZ042_13115 [Listeria monocytogenes]|uniref:exonuclease domain-containing protein n=1 Tax=Listeria monocytogenes TaxID=1639 RepID=UPI0011EB0649|nr:exonuclease domain-containing protein [Listeria monocytogenes]TYV61063.1 hypothetical protein FZ042_13115 [Listeria monocytogenes]